MSERITKKKIVNAIVDSGGIMNVIAKRCGCCYMTIFRKLRKWPDLKELLELEKEKTLDMAESQLIKKIENGDNTMIIFYMKTKGKSRGYIERSEHEIEVSKVPEINVSFTK